MSALPWREGVHMSGFVLNADGQCVADCQIRTLASATANVALIVRAVNAHNDLLGALRSLLPFAHEAPDVVLDGALAALAKAMGGGE